MADFGSSLVEGLFSLAGSGLQANAANRATRAQERMQRERAQRIAEAADYADMTYDEARDIIEQNRAGQYQYATPEMAAEYTSAIQGFDPNKFVYDFDEFSFDKTRDDYVTPYMDDILSQVEARVQGTAAGAGLGRGTGTAEAIASADAEKMNELYQQANQQYQQDKQFAYQTYSDYIKNMQSKYNTLANLTSEKIKLTGGALEHDEKQQSDYMADVLGVLGDKAQSRVTAMINT